MTPKSTRLRFIQAKDSDDLSAVISRLPFKVELKTIVWNGSAWVAWFVLPEDEGLNFNNLVL